MAQLGVLDLGGRVDGGFADHFDQRLAHGKKFRHGRGHVLHTSVHAAAVEVGRNRIGIESLLDGGHGVTEYKTATAVADIEDHAALAGLPEVVVELAVLI